jgi:ribosomal-protein-alanine N-acetyltransferase
MLLPPSTRPSGPTEKRSSASVHEINDRGDEFFDSFPEQHDALLADQDAGVCAFYVLVEPDGTIVGRFNLYELKDGMANVGYRIAERVAGQGVATAALRDLCRRAAVDHGLRVLNAEASEGNLASQRVLEKSGFARPGLVWSAANLD